LKNEANIVIGGKAGDGIRAAGEVLGEIFNRHGLFTFVREDYQSLIRGGHNYSQIRASSDRVWSQYSPADVVVAMDERSIDNHEDRLGEDDKLIFDSDKVDYDGEAGRPMPLSSMVEKEEGIEVMRNSVAIGAIAHLYGLDLGIVEGVMEKNYGKKAEKNVLLAEKGYEYSEENFEKVIEIEFPEDKEIVPFLTGNQAISLGASKAGLDMYIAYPMTPSTSILHFTANYRDELGLTVVQPENEIGVINMALGSAYAGARSMVGTSGGGFALMQEALSMSGISETPLLIIECQRAGPSTGVPTYTSQADLKFALNSAHGEFPSIVLAPGDPAEAYYRAGEALNLAWIHQIPVILLSDKHLSESRMSIEIDFDGVSPEAEKRAESPGEDYKRYRFTEDGISPLARPGTSDAMVKVTSYEHDEYGYTTEDPEGIVAMQDKRKRKWEGIEEDVKNRNPLKVHGEDDSKDLILAWGSTKGAVLEAMEILDFPVKFVQPIYLKPFPSEKVLEHIESAERAICVEANSTGQLADLIRKEVLEDVDERILKYDMRPFDPPELAERLREAFK